MFDEQNERARRGYPSPEGQERQRYYNFEENVLIYPAGFWRGSRKKINSFC